MLSLPIPNSSDSIPIIGYGSGTKWQWKKKANAESAATFDNPKNTDPDLVNSVKDALKLGFIHLDTAEFYTTRPDIGKGVNEFLKENSSISRSDLFITDKYHHDPPHVKKVDGEVRGPYKSLKEGLKLMDLEYIDLFLLHTVATPEGMDVVQAWNEMIQLKEEGLVRNIGVSNYDVKNLELLKKSCKFQPQVLQIEFHPYLQNQSTGIHQYCKENNILVEAYGPLIPITKCKKGPLLPLLEKLAAKYQITDSQILLKWIHSKGCVSITTTSNIERMHQVLDVLTLEISPDDLEEITKVGNTYFFRAFDIPPLPSYDEELKKQLNIE